MSRRQATSALLIVVTLAVASGAVVRTEPIGGAAAVGSIAAGSVSPYHAGTERARSLRDGRRDGTTGDLPGAGAARDPGTHAPRSHHPSMRAADATRLDRDAVRRRLREHAAGTYIGDVLLVHDSALTRWPDRTRRPLRVWLQPEPAVWDFDPAFATQVRDAFIEWESTGIPVRFEFVPDSTMADVHVTWVDEFAEPISGKTVWSRDDAWWIVDARIVLAVHHSGGEALDLAAMHAIALHEVGHLLGLDHARDPATIMTPRVRVRELSEPDRATARLLYSLPPGAVR